MTVLSQDEMRRRAEQARVDAMEKNRPECALTHLEEAVALWRSPLLGNIASSVLAYRERLLGRLLGLVEVPEEPDQ